MLRYNSLSNFHTKLQAQKKADNTQKSQVVQKRVLAPKDTNKAKFTNSAITEKNKKRDEKLRYKENKKEFKESN